MAIIRPPADWHWVKVLRAKQAPAYSQSSGIVQISVSYIIGCTSRSIKVANPYGLSVRTTEFDLFHSLTAVGPISYGYNIILRV